ncbi:MAG: tetratricopeptide repeat protein [Chromatiales bacterium]|nr:tetratricopeptide repeat protein [Chromatiales bacterium]
MNGARFALREPAASALTAPTPWQSRVARWARQSEGRKGRGLVLLAVVVYTPALLFGGFVSDDWIFVTEPLVRRLDGIVSIWLSPAEIGHENHYWPIAYTTFWIEHKLWGFDPAGYHAVNIALHALNSVLVWRLLLRLGVPGAWLVGAVFAVHPVHVESVAWVIERKDLLSALFYLGAVHVWLRFTEAPGPGRYLLCLAFFAAALLSKSIAVTLPAALLLLRWWQAGRVTWRDAACVAPLFALALGVTLADLAFYRDRIDSALDYSLVERALIAARALWVYAHQLVWPVSLPVLYTRWDVHPGDLLGWLAIAALAALGAALWLARDRIGRGPLAGVLFFALTLSPVLGFVDFRFMKIAFVADRFQYLASIGPLAVVLGAGVHLAGRLHPPGRAAAVVTAAAVLSVLGALGQRQSGIYRDDLTYARHIDAVNPRHYAGQLALSRHLGDAGHHEEALAAARRGVALAEGRRGNHSHWAYADLGNALLALERPVEAETAFRTSLALWPRSERHKPRLLLARALVRQARYEEGLALYRALIREDPDDDAVHLLQGMALLESGRHEAAVESFDRALAKLRDLRTEPALHVLLGEAQRKLGRPDAAAAHLDRALALEPDNVWFLLARVDLARERARERQRAAGLPVDGRNGSMGQAAGRAGREAWAEAAEELHVRLAEARERCETAIEQEPGSAFARVALGEVLRRMDEYETVAAVLEEALALAPSRPVARDAHRALGEVFEKQGRFEAAARHWRGALDIHPFDATALERLAGLRLREGRYGDALPLYRGLVEATPFVAQAHVDLGVTLYRTGRLHEALLALDRALALAPGLEAARDLRSRVLEAQAASGTSGAAAPGGATLGAAARRAARS